MLRLCFFFTKPVVFSSLSLLSSWCHSFMLFYSLSLSGVLLTSAFVLLIWCWNQNACDSVQFCFITISFISMLVCLASSVSDTDTQTHTQMQPGSAMCVYHSKRKIPSGAGGKSRSTSSWDDYTHGKQFSRLPPTLMDTHHTPASAHTAIPEY